MYNYNLGTFTVLEPQGKEELEKARKYAEQFKVGDIVRVERAWTKINKLAPLITEITEVLYSARYYLKIKSSPEDASGIDFQGRPVTFAFATFVTHEKNKANRFRYHMEGPYMDA